MLEHISNSFNVTSVDDVFQVSAYFNFHCFMFTHLTEERGKNVLSEHINVLHKDIKMMKEIKMVPERLCYHLQR